MEEERRGRRKDEEEQPPPVTPIWRSLPVIAAAVTGLVLIVVMLFVFVFSKDTPSGAGKKASEGQVDKGDGESAESKDPNVIIIDDPDGVLPGALIKLAPFVVNLNSEKVFFNFEIFIELFDFEPPEGFDRYMPKIRHAVLVTANNKTLKQLLSEHGKEKLRLELVIAINEELGESAEVVDLYFANYYIQDTEA